MTFAIRQKKDKLKTSKKKEVKNNSTENMLGHLLKFSTKNDLVLQKVMEYPLGPVPEALAIPDEFPIKTNEAGLIHKLRDTSAIKSPAIDQKHIHIIDGNLNIMLCMCLIYQTHLVSCPAEYFVLSPKLPRPTSLQRIP
ncbi:hypothetical protein PoB_006224600 [Plakobranchus ocellatus]|uniref:Reverse transcriptase domain-containing protein n=1 Tax=Plakobranchus ocellatus TaxID=259542 RepID=A0AAV4CV03_9GAST|nr:hypothetical protein PoB_006224600 [Plakobranchus ocellatus]